MSYEGQYNPALVTASVGSPVGVGGVDIAIPLPQGLQFPLVVVGKAPDSFYTVANTADAVGLVAGAEGNVTHVINPDESGTITLTVTRGSLTNTAFSLLFRAQRAMGQAGGLPAFNFPITIRDNNTSPPTVHEAANCLVQRQPDEDFGASEGTTAWGFMAVQIISNRQGRLT